MRIALLVHGLPPAAWGGTELHTLALARALVDLGHELLVVAREADPERPELALRHQRREGFELLWVNNCFRDLASFADGYRRPKLAAAVLPELESWKAEVVHAQHLTCLSTELALACAERWPLLLTLNDYWMICHRGQLFDRRLQRCAGSHRGCRDCLGEQAAPAPLFRLGARLPTGLKRLLAPALPSPESGPLEARRRHLLEVLEAARLVLCPSATLELRFRDFGVSPARLRRIRQGIPSARFAGAELPKRRPGEPLRLLFLGSLMVSKAPHLVLEAVRALTPERVRLTVAGGFADYHGDGSYRGVLEPLLDHPAIDHRGTLPHDRVPALIAAHHALVISSVWLENAPFVIREAHLARRPVLASDLGGMAEMVAHEVDGLRFEAGSAAALGAAIERLEGEPGLLERLAAAAPDERDIAAQADELVTLYRSLR